MKLRLHPSVTPPAVPAPWLLRLAYGPLLVLLLACLVPLRVGVTDTFMQLAIGRYYLTHGFFTRDAFSYATPVQPLVDHERLALRRPDRQCVPPPEPAPSGPCA